jgi:nitroimidazol reductase NimA-like FMN-containing flavoprotein (pyridoxamine 5'-phosphate oxidase superfamily)
MPRPLTEQEREDFLAERHVAVLSLPSDNERPPLAFPVWYGYRPGGEITYYTHRSEPRSRKLRLLHEGSVVSLCVQREELPYKYVTVEGTVIAENDSPTAEQMLAIVRRYLSADDAQAFLESEMKSVATLVLFTIRPDRWAGLDFGEDAG